MTTALALIPACFFAGLLWGPWLIKRLQLLKFGKQIRLEGQEHHLSKAGTPTMGGWLFVVTALIAIALAIPEPRVVVPLLASVLLFAIFGGLDDYANMKNKEGLGFQVRFQILIQFAIALGVGAALFFLYGVQTVNVPFVGELQIGVWMVPFTAFVIFATTAGTNLADGLDGLAGGTGMIALTAFMVIALREGDTALAGACGALIGSLMAFLWFNAFPARLFMGGVGSLAIGAALATIALLSGHVLLIPIIGALYVVELLSVILQVGYFKMTGGKRLFRRSPIHHHFELLGLHEVTVTQRFWLVAILCAVAGILVSEMPA